MHLDEIDTPALVIDLDIVQANIERLQHYLDQHRLANRPHIKTHKLPQIARMQVEAGAVGLTCQKLGEAEVMAQAGLSDLLIPYNIVGAAKLERLMALARGNTISVTADSHVVVQGLSAAAHAAGLHLGVLVECDTGMGRCGVQTPHEAADLARAIARAPGLQFGGLMTYPNSAVLDAFVQEVRALLAGDGLPVTHVTGGGSVNLWQAHTCREITEHRAGEYVYGDRRHYQSGRTPLEAIAARVVTTVVSRPTPTRAILDAGSKALTADLAGLAGHGWLVEYPQAQLYAVSEEHGYVDCSACPKPPEIGERVSVLPNHVCVVTNLFNHVHVVRAGQVEAVWPVAARGLLQ
jgi:D-serine deaminase-like pyridoxal phosphate-dependent protein